METTTSTEPNYGNYDSAIQMMLPMDISKKIDENDPLVSFVKAMKGLNLHSYKETSAQRQS